jgi:DNA-binding transcriptional ArsR family regulator
VIIPFVGSQVGEAPVAATAKLFADGTRAAFCLALLDGRYRTAGELARGAGVTASTASEHLSQLVAGGVLAVDPQGRRRYFRLAGPKVAALLEALAVAAPSGDESPPDLGRAESALRAGRTCYDHLAGRLGVALTDALIAVEVITAEFTLGDRSRLIPLGIELPPESARPVVRPCLDWTERRHHAAGSLPAALTRRFFELGWLQRATHGRAVRLTELGQQGLSDLLGTQLPFPDDRFR